MSGADWRPSATLAALRARAALLARARAFLAGRGVMEVETPCLASAPVTDAHIACISAVVHGGPRPRRLYLQSSPEYAMKRLLAAGSGPIYQLGKVFRDGELGALHAPEFTMLEWYRTGLDHHALAEETVELLGLLTGLEAVAAVDYGEVFAVATGVDPHGCTGRSLQRFAARHCNVDAAALQALSRSDLLDLVFATCVQPGLRGIVAVVDYPACQAALARVVGKERARAARFEAFIDGIEVANGYHELDDPGEQRRRMLGDLQERARLGRPAVPLDERLVAALEAGIGDVAGVAVGFDRVVACALGEERIERVIAFGAGAA